MDALILNLSVAEWLLLLALCTLGGFATWLALQEFYEWAVDEYIDWRLRRIVKKLYWFLPK